jgi:threonine/homoserine/homoserine lactone efflux protein
MLIDGYLWIYVPAVALLTVTPGVDSLMVVRNTLRGGWRDGVLTSIAICCGLFVHALISAGGISLILMQSAALFGALKLAGAGYLVWLGIQSLRAAAKGGALAMPAAVRRAPLPARVPLREGFLSNVLNPKAIVFYMAFLPQFIQPQEAAMLKALFLAGIHFLLANLWQLLLVLLVLKARRWLAATGVRRTLDGITGSVMVALGIRLGIES